MIYEEFICWLFQYYAGADSVDVFHLEFSEDRLLAVLTVGAF
jgi:hypothetical protein